MINLTNQEHDQLQKRIAEKYLQDGYTVIVKPLPQDLPFNLGSYRPDIIVKKKNSGGEIIEIKNTTASTNVDRLREVAETVAEHTGWRFLLVTGDDVTENETEQNYEELLSWDQIRDRKEKGERLIRIGENEGAYMLFWGIIEALLRKQAERKSIPIERFPSASLIKQLYSQGELSIDYFEILSKLIEIRNQLVHGFQSSITKLTIDELQNLVNELINEWEPKENLQK